MLRVCTFDLQDPIGSGRLVAVQVLPSRPRLIPKIPSPGILHKGPRTLSHGIGVGVVIVGVGAGLSTCFRECRAYILCRASFYQAPLIHLLHQNAISALQTLNQRVSEDRYGEFNYGTS